MSIFNFEMQNVPFASGADISEISDFSDWLRGLGIAFDETEGKPEMKGLNGLFKVITTSILYLKQRGVSEWDKNLEYTDASWVSYSGKLYKSKRVSTGKQPNISQSDWSIWASISDIKVSTNGNLKKTENEDGSITLEVPTASTEQRGSIRQANATEVVNKSNVPAAVNPKQVEDIINSMCLGFGQKYYNLTSSRVIGQTYTNNTGKPIEVTIALSDTNGQTPNVTITVGGVQILSLVYDSGNNYGTFAHSFIVPNNTTYVVRISGASAPSFNWSELR